MDLGLHQQTVFVTGASSGIGRSIAKVFGQEKANVVVTYHRDSVAAEETVRDIEAAGGKGLALQMTLSDPASIRLAVTKTVEVFGSIAVLVNNALDWSKRQQNDTFENTSSDDWFKMVQTNLFGTYMVTKAVIPAMRQRSWGRIVHISSDLAADGMPGSTSYTSTKSALHGLSKSLSKELAEQGIFSNVVLPGLTITEKAKSSFAPEVVAALAKQNPTGRLGTPEDVANVVVFLGSLANSFVNGEIIRVTGGHSGGYYVPV